MSFVFLDMKGDLEGVICNRVRVSSVAFVVCELQRIKK